MSRPAAGRIEITVNSPGFRPARTKVEVPVAETILATGRTFGGLSMLPGTEDGPGWGAGESEVTE